jgi:hypothetical protein
MASDIFSDNKTQFIKWFGFGAIWFAWAMSAYTSVILINNQTVNILIPFITFIIIGIAFSSIWSVVGLVCDKNAIRSLAGIVDISFVAIAIVSAILSFYSITQIDKQVNISIDIFTSFDCILGIVLSFIGLLVFTISYLSKLLEK